jgi:hypothetical protein
VFETFYHIIQIPPIGQLCDFSRPLFHSNRSEQVIVDPGNTQKATTHRVRCGLLRVAWIDDDLFTAIRVEKGTRKIT